MKNKNGEWESNQRMEQEWNTLPSYPILLLKTVSPAMTVPGRFLQL